MPSAPCRLLAYCRVRAFPAKVYVPDMCRCRTHWAGSP
jgi:hypothetical protein